MTKTPKLNGSDLGFPFGPSPVIIPGKRHNLGPGGGGGQIPSKKQICQMTCEKLTNIKDKSFCLKICEGTPFDPNKPFYPKNFEKKIKEIENQIESQIEKDMCKKYSGEEDCINDCSKIIHSKGFGSMPEPNICKNVCDKMNTLCKPSGPSGPSGRITIDKYCYYNGSCTTNFNPHSNCIKFNTKNECEKANKIGPYSPSKGLSVGSIVVIVSLSSLLLILIFMVMTGRIKL